MSWVAGCCFFEAQHIPDLCFLVFCLFVFCPLDFVEQISVSFNVTLMSLQIHAVIAQVLLPR